MANQVRINFTGAPRGSINDDLFDDDDMSHETASDLRIHHDQDFERLREYLRQRSRLWEAPPKWLKVTVLSLLGITCCLVVVLVPVVGSLGSHITADRDIPVDPTDVLPFPPVSQYPAPHRYERGSVASDHPTCSTVGVDILKMGGNAVDAAIAACLCLGVLNPQASGIGGGGSMVVRLANGKHEVYDFREKAPMAASRDMFLTNPKASTKGGLAVAVPGELKGLRAAWEDHGSRNVSWAQIVEPAANLARFGFPVGSKLASTIKSEEQEILANPQMRNLFAPNGVILTKGETAKNVKLGETLQRVANEGVEILYTGDLATQLAQDIAEAGGIITAEDLAGFTAVKRKPLENYFQGYQIVGAGPPISGGAVGILALNILERFNLPLLSRTDYPLAIHLIQEAFKFGYSDRMALGDPDFENMTSILEAMLSKSHAGDLRGRLRENQAFPPSYYIDLTNEVNPINDGGTTHLSVVDAHRNAVALTSTINLDFGSYVVSNSTGIILNNQMDDFSSPNQTNTFGYPPSRANYIKPGKRPLSSMTPTIVSKDGKLHTVIGASGGSRIITGTLWALLHVLAFDKDISEAIYMPRIHCQLFPPVVKAEKGTPQNVIDKLTAVGNQVDTIPVAQSAVQGIVVDANGSLLAQSDPRKSGIPDGY